MPKIVIKKRNKAISAKVDKVQQTLEKHDADMKMMHQRGETNAGIAQAVYLQLEEDYGKKYLGWVKAASWEGPIDVALEEINTSNRANWEAMQDLAHVDDFTKQVKDGSVKPIILVNEPNNDKMMIIDGHHRYLAAEKVGVPVKAYIGIVGGVGGPWVDLHDKQHDSTNGIESSKQKSNLIRR